MKSISNPRLTPRILFPSWHRPCPRPAGVKVEAKSELVKPDSLPMQLHTSATAAPGQLQIMWVDDVADAAPTVQYGKTAAALDKSATGTSSTYTQEELSKCVTADTTAVMRFIAGLQNLGGRNGFPPPEKHELVLFIEMGCADTVHFNQNPNTPF